ncbi:MAG TPA: DNA mismatch repair endonuclease MutL [Planctomycetota bacterium]|nr:DNA mismatch repair endonuclease MutL [Planctomycetota bacterium]
MDSNPLAKIQTLPTWLVNKIAAGEVIERPASCVKELIENSLDAGATDIQVTLKEGGKKLIRVADNGNGILAGDLSLVFKSHSTSKIIEEADLYNINTFGFRGEALASMASIAQVRLISKSASQPDAYEISVDNDQVSPPQPVAGVTGTTIEIANLFYQTPARRKFLKSDSVELSHISETVTRFAIAYPEISFKLMNLPDNSSDTDSPASTRQSLMNLNSTTDDLSQGILQRLGFFYGPDISQELLCATEEKDNLKLTAYFSNPTQTKSNSKYQFFYLNRRFIRDRILSRAIYQAYHNLIPAGRYPFAALFIQMPTSAFDVNVHPTKIEVRFRDAWKVHDRIISLIRNTLAQKASNGEITLIENAPPQAETTENQRVMQALVDFFVNKGDTTPEPNRQTSPFSPSSSPLPSSAPTPADPLHSYKSEPSITTLTSPLQALAPESLTIGRCFQIHNSYIIEEVPDGILIIDQHALHERILYNRFSQQITSSEIYRQKFLIPTVVEIPKAKSMILPEVIPYLKKVGIEVEEFGENTIAVQSAPSLLNNVNFTDFILEFIDAFADDFKDDSRAKTEQSENIKPIDNLIKMMACKAAIKAGDPLKDEEIKTLLADAKGMDFITCPHGRPAVRKITLPELEGYFQR